MPPSSRPIDALGGVPGSHLGLTWEATEPATLGEIVALTRLCEEVDGARVRSPGVAVERIHLPADARSVAMAGRDSKGELRACASTRAADGDAVAVRALVHPAWRGRGVGRAVLAWQDRWAREFLDDVTPSIIGVPIASHLVDRRRLYTAAGFSCKARIEIHSRHLGDAPDRRERHLAPVDPAPGWETRPLGPDDGGAVLALARVADRNRHAFVAAGLTVPELLATCDPTISRVAVHGGEVRGAVLAHSTTDVAGTPVGWIRTLLLDRAADLVAEGLLGSVFHEMWVAGFHRAHVFVTPAMTAWRGTLAELACHPQDVELLYSIEMP